jgi:hypothetical protein
VVGKETVAQESVGNGKTGLWKGNALQRRISRDAGCKKIWQVLGKVKPASSLNGRAGEGSHEHSFP